MKALKLLTQPGGPALAPEDMALCLGCLFTMVRLGLCVAAVRGPLPLY